MEWIFVGFLYSASVVVAFYKFGPIGALGISVFAVVQAIGIQYEWSENPLVAIFIAGFAAFIVLIACRQCIIGRKRFPDEDF